MKSEELRIDNYIKLYRNVEDKEMTFHKVKSIFFSNELNCYCVDLEDGFVVNSISGFEPIPLTEEILLKCGFEIIFVDFKHFYKYKEFYLYDNFQPCDVDIKYDLQYLHQLQNLYFVLTGQELNYEIRQFDRKYF